LFIIKNINTVLYAILYSMDFI